MSPYATFPYGKAITTRNQEQVLAPGPGPQELQERVPVRAQELQEQASARVQVPGREPQAQEQARAAGSEPV